MSDHRVMLAIETSQRAGGVALRTPAGEIDRELVEGRRRHDDDLVPSIARLFARHGLRASDLEIVAASIGPGGFTGLRIGLATARTLGETLGVQLVAVPTAIAVAEAHRDEHGDDGPFLVALCAKGDTVWATRVDHDGAEWRVAGEPGIVRDVDLDLGGLTAVVADAYLPDVARQRCQAVAVPVRVPRFDPVACLQAAERMLARGETTDVLALNPLYARAPSAIPPRSRRPVR